MVTLGDYRDMYFFEGEGKKGTFGEYRGVHETFF